MIIFVINITAIEVFSATCFRNPIFFPIVGRYGLCGLFLIESFHRCDHEVSVGVQWHFNLPPLQRNRFNSFLCVLFFKTHCALFELHNSTAFPLQSAYRDFHCIAIILFSRLTSSLNRFLFCMNLSVPSIICEKS